MKGPDGQDLELRDYFGKTKLDREHIAQLIQDYYDERGWSPTGDPPPAR
jgi:hypothetical protein